MNNKYLLILLICLGTVGVLSAQHIVQFDEVDDISLQERFASIQSTVYAENGRFRAIGDEPTMLFTDAASTSMAHEMLNQYPSIEIIELRVHDSSDFNRIDFDPAFVAGASSLQGVLIRSEVSAQVSQFEQAFEALQELSIPLIYEIAIPK